MVQGMYRGYISLYDIQWLCVHRRPSHRHGVLKGVQRSYVCHFAFPHKYNIYDRSIHDHITTLDHQGEELHQPQLCIAGGE